MIHRRFTDDEIASALATLQANGGNAKKTANALGISRTTLRQWAGRAKSTTAHPKQVPATLVEEKSHVLAENLEALALKSVELADGKAGEASYKDLLIGAGIAIEKVQLLRGRPTSRLESVKIVLAGGFPSLRELGQAVIEGSYVEAVPEPDRAKTPPALPPKSLG